MMSYLHYIVVVAAVGDVGLSKLGKSRGTHRRKYK